VCEACGRTLKAQFRGRALVAGFSMIASIFFRTATLVLNPRLNPRKDSELAAAIELGLMRLLWATKCVQVKALNP
jgi:hypothetical protein